MCNSYKITGLTGKNMFFELTTQEYHSEFSITNQKEKELWEDPSNTGMRL